MNKKLHLTLTASLLAAGIAQASIISSGPLDQDFGGAAVVYNLIMEGTLDEFDLLGYDNSGYIGFYSQRRNSAKMYGSDMLSGGNVVGSASNTPTYSQAWFYSSWSSDMNWDTDGDVGYTGVSFEREDTGNLVYGWMQIERTSATSGKLLGWAYEDDGSAITVIPEPSVLALGGVFGLGLVGVRRFFLI